LPKPVAAVFAKCRLFSAGSFLFHFAVVLVKWFGVGSPKEAILKNGLALPLSPIISVKTTALYAVLHK